MFGVDISVWSVTWSAVALCCVVLTQIYYASEEFGVHDIQTSGGYFHMAEVFQQQGNVTVAQSLYRQVMCCHSSFSVLSPSDAALLVAVRPVCTSKPASEITTNRCCSCQKLINRNGM